MADGSPADIEVRRATPMDDVATIMRAAFASEGRTAADNVASVWAEVEASPHARGSLVAEIDRTVVGHVGLSRAWLDARRELIEIWMLSPLSVHPDHQGRGVGTALLGAAVALASGSGTPMLLLEGDPRYYGARGFGPASSYGVEPGTRRTPAPACQVVAFDAWETWMGGRLVYPEAWWRHDCTGLRDPMLTEVEEALGIPPA